VSPSAFLHTDGVSIESRGERGSDALRARRSFVRHAERSGGLIAVCITIWLIGGAGYFWPIWVILVVVLRLGIRARRAWASSAYDD
jgi:hypothetical protein